MANVATTYGLSDGVDLFDAVYRAATRRVIGVAALPSDAALSLTARVLRAVVVHHAATVALLFALSNQTPTRAIRETTRTSHTRTAAGAWVSRITGDIEVDGASLIPRTGLRCGDYDDFLAAVATRAGLAGAAVGTTETPPGMHVVIETKIGAIPARWNTRHA